MHHDVKGECFSTAMYMSPVEILIHIFPNAMIGPIIVFLFKGFIYKEGFIFWICLSVFYFIWSHTGITDSQYMPSVKHHYDHHKYYNCNYGTVLTDTIFGTVHKSS